MSDQVIYTVGGTVQASGGIYISREADEELLQLCRAGEFCYVLTPRQMGKSSLMVATRERLATEDIRSVEIDLTKMGSELSGLTAEQWYLGLIDLIVEQLDLDVDYVAWWDERAHLGPTQRLSQFLRQVVLEQVSEPVVIFIDEIDSTLNLDFADDFFAAIRGCYNARAGDSAFKRLSFVLLGVATPSDLISDPRHTPFNIGQRMDLSDFTYQQAMPLADGLGLPPEEAGKVLTQILDWTGGHPYLTQCLCAAAAVSPMKNWNAAVVGKLVEETFFGEQSAQDSNLQFVRNMLTQRATDKAAVLKTYRRIHAGKAVPDEERSPVKTHLKLSGVVKWKEGKLTVRNRIYEQVFNQEWISQNTPVDWTRRIAIVSTILAVVLGGLFGYYTYRQGQQTTEARAQAFIDSFRSTTSADIRITSLAGLFELSGYEDQARQLFYEELSPEEQRALFEKVDPQAVGRQLVIVVKELYTELENNDQGNQLLEAMVHPLHELDNPMVVNLTTEIEQWIQGRKAYAKREYEQAVIAYSVAINLNDANPATHFERAIAHAGWGRYGEALADFERTLQLDEKRALIVDKEIRSNVILYNTLTADRIRYQKLAAVVPTPTSSPPPLPGAFTGKVCQIKEGWDENTVFLRQTEFNALRLPIGTKVTVTVRDTGRSVENVMLGLDSNLEFCSVRLAKLLREALGVDSDTAIEPERDRPDRRFDITQTSPPTNRERLDFQGKACQIESGQDPNTVLLRQVEYNAFGVPAGTTVNVTVLDTGKTIEKVTLGLDSSLAICSVRLSKSLRVALGVDGDTAIEPERDRPDRQFSIRLPQP